ncbi:MAG: hypothetical protein M1825_004462 [Sarcosagium campestre]|nr:MAG: hypothetical protein M1825_004462 [Sarcosagium campestre]
MLNEEGIEQEKLHQSQVFSQFEIYPWDGDAAFQQGLSTILKDTSSAEQRQELTLRAKTFYYSRKFGFGIDIEAYKIWLLQKDRGSGTSNVSGDAVTTTLSASTISERGSLPQRAEQHSKASSDADADAPFPNAFAHIVNLITKGETVPGIRDIPNTVLEGQRSESTVAPRRKPWERQKSDDTQQLGSSTDQTLG